MNHVAEAFHSMLGVLSYNGRRLFWKIPKLGSLEAADLYIWILHQNGVTQLIGMSPLLVIVRGTLLQHQQICAKSVPSVYTASECCIGVTSGLLSMSSYGAYALCLGGSDPQVWKSPARSRGEGKAPPPNATYTVPGGSILTIVLLLLLCVDGTYANDRNSIAGRAHVLI